MIGDRMDTAIVGAVSSGLDTNLVLSGVTQAEDIPKFPYQPTYVLDSIADMQIPEDAEPEEGEFAEAEDEAAQKTWTDGSNVDLDGAASRKPKRQLEKVKS